MGKVAFIFPGQGAQFVGMAGQIIQDCPAGRALFSQADRELQFSLSALCNEGPAATLNATENTQPALLATSVALLRGLEQQPDVVAGHSLGEYSACVAAGVLSFEEALHLVRARGLFMQEAMPDGTGAMAALLGGDPDEVTRLVSSVGEAVQVANFNAPGQLVVAGTSAGIEGLTPELEAIGVRVVRLAVSAAFHSSFMQSAAERLAVKLESAQIRDAQAPVYVNVDAKPLRTAPELREALRRQVCSAVNWIESVKCMRRDGVELFVEIGPSKVLSRLVRRIDPEARCFQVRTPQDFAAARLAIAAARADVKEQAPAASAAIGSRG